MGHAIENMYKLSHGEAISIGMVVAARLSEKLTGFKDTAILAQTLSRYGLPVEKDYDKEKAFSILEMDKKKSNKDMNYVLLEKIGAGIVKPIPLTRLKELLIGDR
jgi:3-dehydroquinate synthetase